MSPERAQLLAELLREMREQDDGYLPDEAWYDIDNDATPDGSDVQAELKSLLG